MDPREMGSVNISISTPAAITPFFRRPETGREVDRDTEQMVLQTQGGTARSGTSHRAYRENRADMRAPCQEGTVEKRKSRRVFVQEDVSGRTLLAAGLDIRDLSLNGIRFLCRERVAPTNRIHPAIQKNGLQVRVGGAAPRARRALPSTASQGRLMPDSKGL
jgi:hypothetical protein